VIKSTGNDDSNYNWCAGGWAAGRLGGWSVFNAVQSFLISYICRKLCTGWSALLCFLYLLWRLTWI